MRLGDIIAFGTRGYPEKTARRLRAVNLTAWFFAALTYSFAIRRLLDPSPGMLERGLVNAAIATCFAALPLLHRIGPSAALVALIGLGYAYAARVVWQVGTAGGTWLGYFSAIALAVILFGADRYLLAGLLALAAGSMVIVLHLVVPRNAGMLTDDALLYGNFITNVVVNTALLFAVVLYAARQVQRAEETAERERERSDSLLANILPVAVAERLKAAPGERIAERRDEATVLFADMAGFTAKAATMAPEALVGFLDRVYSAFDRLVERHGLEKIKTSGDAYMVVAGVPAPRTGHAGAIAALALDMLAEAGRIEGGVPVRIGIASGPVVAGVVGSRKFFYDVWGDTVNMAARMEATGEAGMIQVAPEARHLLEEGYLLERRGKVEIKGKGRVETWWLAGRKVAPSG